MSNTSRKHAAPASGREDFLEPFDLAGARSGRKTVTAYGDRVEIVSYQGHDPDYPLVAIIDDGEDYHLETFDTLGRDRHGRQALHLLPGKNAFFVPERRPDDFFRGQDFWLVARLRADSAWRCDPQDCRLFRKKDKAAMLAWVEHRNSLCNDACTRKGLILYLDRKKAEKNRQDIFVPVWIGTENPGLVIREIESENQQKTDNNGKD